MRIRELFERYAENVALRGGRTTNRRHVLYAADVLESHFGTRRSVETLTTGDVTQFAAERVEEVSRNTVNATLRQLKAALRRGVREGWLEPGFVFPHVELLKVLRSEPRTIAESEFARLFAVADSPLREALAIGYEAGLRVGEIAHLSPSDIDFDRRLVHVRAKAGIWQPKAGYERASWLTKALAQELKPMVDRGGLWLFPSPKSSRRPRTDLQALAHDAFKRADLPGHGFHSLRRSWATRAARRGVPMHVIKKAGGWRSLSVVERYVSAALDDVAAWA